MVQKARKDNWQRQQLSFNSWQKWMLPNEKQCMCGGCAVIALSLCHICRTRLNRRRRVVFQWTQSTQDDSMRGHEATCHGGNVQCFSRRLVCLNTWSPEALVIIIVFTILKKTHFTCI